MRKRRASPRNPTRRKPNAPHEDQLTAKNQKEKRKVQSKGLQGETPRSRNINPISVAQYNREETHGPGDTIETTCDHVSEYKNDSRKVKNWKPNQRQKAVCRLVPGNGNKSNNANRTGSEKF